MPNTPNLNKVLNYQRLKTKYWTYLNKQSKRNYIDINVLNNHHKTVDVVYPKKKKKLSIVRSPIIENKTMTKALNI